jgi:hypothetical protein
MQLERSFRFYDNRAVFGGVTIGVSRFEWPVNFGSLSLDRYLVDIAARDLARYRRASTTPLSVSGFLLIRLEYLINVLDEHCSTLCRDHSCITTIGAEVEVGTNHRVSSDLERHRAHCLLALVDARFDFFIHHIGFSAKDVRDV